MTREMSIDMWVNTVASGVAALACAIFVVAYHFRAPWWRSDTGRNLMAAGAAFGLLFLYTVLITLWPDGCPAAVLRSIRTAVVLAIAALMVQRTRMVLRAQRHDHKGARL